MSQTRLIVGGALLALLALFVVLNLEPARINFLVARVDTPIAFAILFSAALGAGAALAFRWLRAFRRPPPPK